QDDLGIPIPVSGNLERWATQGVLLLNATLTVRAGQAGSHQGKGWEQFTDAVIKRIANQKKGIVFMLWGRYAQEKGRMISPEKHLVLTSKHPFPVADHSVSCLGNLYFSKVNQFLEIHRIEPIRW